MERALNELVAAARRAGLRVSTAEAIDAVRAATQLGVCERSDFKAALSACLAKDEADRERFSRVFERFFAAQGETHADLFERLRAAGFSPDEVRTLRQLLEATARVHAGGAVYQAIAQGPLAMERLLEQAVRHMGLRRVEPARTGFATMRVLDALHVPRAETELGPLRSSLRDALGSRGDSLADVLAEELSGLRQRARAYVAERNENQASARLDELPFAALDPADVARVERAVRELSERFLGRALVRARRAREGRIDMRRTMRRALRSGGVPFHPERRKKRPHRPRLLVLCDVSDSVRASASFMLLFVHAVQRLFEHARSFVFVSELGDATEVFEREPPQRAIELAYRGAIVSVADNSHYGRVFRRLVARHGALLDTRTTLLILGDGRTNHFDPGEQAFAEIAARVERVLWLSPEPESAWATGDGALPLYARHCDEVLPVYDLRTLRQAARALARF